MFTYKDYGIRYVKLFPFPAALSFGYGVSICTFATIRNRDDIYNPLYAAAFSGILTATLSKYFYCLPFNVLIIKRTTFPWDLQLAQY